MPDQDYQKQCTRCKQSKTAENYVQCSATKDRLHYWCKSCFREVADRRREIRKERALVEPDPSKKRQCARCKTMKPETEFARERITKNGFDFTCKDCNRRQAIMRQLARLESLGPFPADTQTDRINPAYAAGFLDGEGCITIGKARQTGNPQRLYYTLNVTAANTNLAVLQRLEKTYGGSTLGRADHIAKGWKQGYRWRVSSWGAVAFLKEVMPFLIVKRRQAEIALEFQQNMRHSGNRWSVLSDRECEYREKLYWEIRKLNERGPSHARS